MKRKASALTQAAPPKPLKLQPIPLAKCLPKLREQFSSESLLKYSFDKPRPMECYSLLSKTDVDFFLESMFEQVGLCHQNTLQVVGLDTETCTKRANQNTASRTYPSTIQLAFGEDVVAIVHIYHICQVRRETFPVSLKRLLTSSNILKAGVNLSNDILGFKDHFDVTVSNTVDIDKIAKPLGLPRLSLAGLAYVYTGEIMDKAKKLVFSPWDSTQLKDRAIAYAAYDALYSREIYYRMMAPPLFQLSTTELDEILKKK